MRGRGCFYSAGQRVCKPDTQIQNDHYTFALTFHQDESKVDWNAILNARIGRTVYKLQGLCFSYEKGLLHA